MASPLPPPRGCPSRIVALGRRWAARWSTAIGTTPSFHTQYTTSSIPRAVGCSNGNHAPPMFIDWRTRNISVRARHTTSSIPLAAATCHLLPTPARYYAVRQCTAVAIKCCRCAPGLLGNVCVCVSTNCNLQSIWVENEETCSREISANAISQDR